MAAEHVRLDRWLWAARFFKARTLATRAVVGGKAHLNGARAKPGAGVRIGDRIEVRRGAFTFDVVVRALGERRGSAADAARLYEETDDSRAARERIATQMRLQPDPAHRGKGRPTKRERRQIDRLKGRD